MPVFDYAIVRVVPRPERGEFVNVGVILSCASPRMLASRIELDEARLLALYPAVDIDLVRGHLAAIPRICAGGADAGPIGLLGVRERFHWLCAQRSAMIQTSPLHTGRSDDPLRTLEHLVGCMVRVPGAASG